MLGLLTLLFTRLFQWLAAVLPGSPFRSLVLSGSYSSALGWLNWLVPVSTLQTITLAWAGALLTSMVITYIIRNVLGKAVNLKAD